MWNFEEPQQPGMMGTSGAGGQGSMAQGGMSGVMGGVQRGVMLDRSASQPVQGQGVPQIQRAASGLPMPSAGMSACCCRCGANMNTSPA